MMDIDEARQFAAQHFPEGPEKLAAKLGIEIHESPLIGCDGWVLSGPAGVVIRLNSKAPAKRRRFTLAHELGHLLLGAPTIVGESVYDSLRSNSREERRVNDLASELLLPRIVVQQYLPSVPVVADQLRKLAGKANVSELAAAIRVTNLAKEVGLVNAAVVFFQSDVLEWLWSKTLKLSPVDAVALLKETRKRDPQPARIERPETNDVIVASMIANPLHQSETLFVQILPTAEGNQLSRAELQRALEEYLFKNDDQFRMSIQGVFGAFRLKCSTMTLEAAIREFYQRYGSRWPGACGVRLHSAKGREYVRLRLSEWCSER